MRTYVMTRQGKEVARFQSLTDNTAMHHAFGLVEGALDFRLYQMQETYKEIHPRTTNTWETDLAYNERSPSRGT